MCSGPLEVVSASLLLGAFWIIFLPCLLSLLQEMGDGSDERCSTGMIFSYGMARHVSQTARVSASFGKRCVSTGNEWIEIC